LGTIQIGLQELETHVSQPGTVSNSLAIGTSKATEMLQAKVSSMIALPNGALTMENEANRPTVSALKGMGWNLAALTGEVLHLMQDGIIVELRACEHHALQVINE